MTFGATATHFLTYTHTYMHILTFAVATNQLENIQKKSGISQKPTAKCYQT